MPSSRKGSRKANPMKMSATKLAVRRSRRGPSNCTGRVQKRCVSPCVWKKGSKQHCSMKRSAAPKRECHGRTKELCGSNPNCNWKKYGKRSKKRSHCVKSRGSRRSGPMLPQDY